MKFRITFKDPDGVYDGIIEAAKGSLDDLPKSLTNNERVLIQDSREDGIRTFVDEFTAHGEYITI